MPPFIPPDEVRTERLLLRRWSPGDTARLLPVLAANAEHLRHLPAQVVGVVPPDELRQRLSSFAADFDAGHSWRYAIFTPDQAGIFGEVALFPRSADGRVTVSCADRVEIGYWLREDATGSGYATEAAAAMEAVAATIPDMVQVEIRCDAGNEPSAAVPRRLGFRLAGGGSVGAERMVWVKELAR